MAARLPSPSFDGRRRGRRRGGGAAVFGDSLVGSVCAWGAISTGRAQGPKFQTAHSRGFRPTNSSVCILFWRAGCRLFQCATRLELLPTLFSSQPLIPGSARVAPTAADPGTRPVAGHIDPLCVPPCAKTGNLPSPRWPRRPAGPISPWLALFLRLPLPSSRQENGNNGGPDIEVLVEFQHKNATETSLTHQKPVIREVAPKSPSVPGALARTSSIGRSGQ